MLAIMLIIVCMALLVWRSCAINSRTSPMQPFFTVCGLVTSTTHPTSTLPPPPPPSHTLTTAMAWASTLTPAMAWANTLTPAMAWASTLTPAMAWANTLTPAMSWGQHTNPSYGMGQHGLSTSRWPMEQEALRWSGPQPLEDLRVLQVHEKLADVLLGKKGHMVI